MIKIFISIEEQKSRYGNIVIKSTEEVEAHRNLIYSKIPRVS